MPHAQSSLSMHIMTYCHVDTFMLAYRQFFDLRHWKVVLVDQRGCGASRPLGCLQDNNTDALVQDYEKLRKRLKIKRWTLLGGSWGVALSLAYAQQHPTRYFYLECYIAPCLSL